MTLNNQISQLEIKLSLLAPRSAAVIAACCAERLFEGYVNFVLKSGWGSVEALRDILNLSWQALETDVIDRELYQEKLNICNSLIPDTEEFELPTVAYALDAAMAVRNTLVCLLENDSKYAVFASRLVFSSIDLYLQRLAIFNNVIESEVDDFVFMHPLMQNEIKLQEQLVSRLIINCNFNIADLHAIRTSCENEIGRVIPHF